MGTEVYSDEDWAECIKLMGKESDEALANRFPMHAKTIGERRRKLGIAKCPQLRQRLKLNPPMPHNDVDRYLYAMFRPLAARYLRGGP